MATVMGDIHLSLKRKGLVNQPVVNYQMRADYL